MKPLMILAPIAGALICAQMFAADNGPKGKIVYYSAYVALSLNPVVNSISSNPRASRESLCTLTDITNSWCHWAVLLPFALGRVCARRRIKIAGDSLKRAASVHSHQHR
jgi:hypothetical protein